MQLCILLFDLRNKFKIFIWDVATKKQKKEKLLKAPLEKQEHLKLPKKLLLKKKGSLFIVYKVKSGIKSKT